MKKQGKSVRNGVTILNDSIKPPLPGKKTRVSTPHVTKNDVQVVTVKKTETSPTKQTKMDHYVVKTLKDEFDTNEHENIDIILASDLGEGNQNEFVDNSQELIVPEELQLSDDDLEEDVKEDVGSVKEIVEHICGKCFKTFRRLKGLKKHLDFCRMDSGYHHRKTEMQNNIEKIEKDSMTMETKDVCFCCGESYDTCHLGHISCPKCPKSFKTQLSYERHLFITHSEEPHFPCTTCNAKMRSKKLLELHEDQHKNRGKPFACKACGKEFTRAYHLKRHQKYSSCSNDPTATISCKVCDKIFYRLDNLRVHLKQHLGQQVTKKPEYMCPVCKNCFYSLSTLNIHTRTHTGEKPFECDLCDKKFSVLVALKKHRRYHTGEKPYKCSVCNSAFAVKEVLNRHMKRHTGDKKHICEDCGKAFIQATQLRNHAKTHIRPFPCKLCDEKLKTQKALERHLKSHRRVNRNDFFCDICKIYFDKSDEHVAHMEKGQHVPATENSKNKKRQKNKQRRDCAVCGTIFPNAVALNFHILKVHEQDPEEFINEKHQSDQNLKSNSPGEAKVAKSVGRLVTNQRGRRSRLGEKSSESLRPAKVCKIEKDSNEGVMILPDSSGIVTNVNSLSNNIVELDTNKSSANGNSGVVVKEYIIDDPPANTSTDTIILNDGQFTIIPLDNYTTVEAKNNSSIRNNDNAQNNDGIVTRKTRFSNRLNKEQRISLGASLAAAIVEDTISDEELEDSDVDDTKPTEDDLILTENVKKLLDMLVDSETLQRFGWPKTTEEEALCKVIENCGHDLSKDAHNYMELDYGTRMREYVKLLFLVVIPNDTIKDLLNNFQIDEVIEFVLGNEEDDEIDLKPPKLEKTRSKTKIKA